MQYSLQSQRLEKSCRVFFFPAYRCFLILPPLLPPSWTCWLCSLCSKPSIHFTFTALALRLMVLWRPPNASTTLHFHFTSYCSREDHSAAAFTNHRVLWLGEAQHCLCSGTAPCHKYSLPLLLLSLFFFFFSFHPQHFPSPQAFRLQTDRLHQTTGSVINFSNLFPGSCILDFPPPLQLRPKAPFRF